jgi:hypothetical protein
MSTERTLCVRSKPTFSGLVQEQEAAKGKANEEQQPKEKSKVDDFFAEMKSLSASKKPSVPTSTAVKGGGLASIMSGLVSARPSSSGGGIKLAG